MVFEGDQHGFRTADSKERAIVTALAFYGAVFGFEPADEVPAVELAGGE